MTRSLSRAGVVALLLALVYGAAVAQPSTFRITQVFSNLDGSVQFIELTESAGLNGQHRLAGLSITSTSKHVVKRFTFASDLPTDQTAHRSIVVATGQLPVNPCFPNKVICSFSSPWYDPEIDYLPIRFVPTDGGSLDFAGVDRMTYASLPTDGQRSQYRDSIWPDQATVPQRCVAAGTCEPRHEVAPFEIFAIEYYHAGLDHYFLTASASEIDALDSGRTGGWTPTGLGFPVEAWVTRSSLQPVCRYHLPPGHGDSHFFSASKEECAVVHTSYPALILESSAAFWVAFPDPVTGSCPEGSQSGSHVGVPVYRLWNRRSNHRYTTDEGIRDQMIQRGWLSEGYGAMGVAMCVWKGAWDYWLSSHRSRLEREER